MYACLLSFSNFRKTITYKILISVRHIIWNILELQTGSNTFTYILQFLYNETYREQVLFLYWYLFNDFVILHSQPSCSTTFLSFFKFAFMTSAMLNRFYPNSVKIILQVLFNDLFGGRKIGLKSQKTLINQGSLCQESEFYYQI